MSDQNAGDAAPKKKLGLGCLFPVIAVVALGAIGYVNTRLSKPERLADVNSCIGPQDGDPIYADTCDSPINLQYCFFSQTSPERDMCRNTELAPGEGLDEQVFNADLRELGGLFRADFMACELPFVPGQYEYWNTRRMTPGCVPPDDPFAGRHISRPGAAPNAPDTEETPEDL